MWLLHYKKTFKIFSSEDIARVISIKRGSLIIENVSRGYQIDLNSVRKIIYRQGDILMSSEVTSNGNKILKDFLRRENAILQQLIHDKIKRIDHLGHPQLADLNKLVVLDKAVKYKLRVPDYIFTSSKLELLSFWGEHRKIITKIILPGFIYEKDSNNYFAYTEVLNQDDLNKLKANFHPTFFQKLVNKKCDIRAFYLNGEFYTIAIISQNNPQTKIDSRNYDRKLPNRQVPFELPKVLKKKLQSLITHLRLKYCSVDLLYGLDKQFYFLEINPIGQFGNVSYSGNYYLEKKMVEALVV